MTPSPVALTIGLLIAVLADAPPAGAQSGLRPYAGGSVGNFSVSADEAEGRSASGGFFAGVALGKYVDVEFDARRSNPLVHADVYGRERVVRASRRVARRGRPAERDHAIRQGARSQREHLRRRDHSPGGGTTPHARPDRRTDTSARARPDGLHADLDPGGHRPRSIRRSSAAPSRLRATSADRPSAASSRLPSRLGCPSSRTCATTTARSAMRSTTRCVFRRGCSGDFEQDAGRRWR